MIANKKYTWGKTFVSSDICRLSKVIYDKRKYLNKIIDKPRADALQDQGKKIYKSDVCKKK